MATRTKKTVSRVQRLTGSAGLGPRQRKKGSEKRKVLAGIAREHLRRGGAGLAQAVRKKYGRTGAPRKVRKLSRVGFLEKLYRK